MYNIHRPLFYPPLFVSTHATVHFEPSCGGRDTQNQRGEFLALVFCIDRSSCSVRADGMLHFGLRPACDRLMRRRRSVSELENHTSAGLRDSHDTQNLNPNVAFSAVSRTVLQKLSIFLRATTRPELGSARR